MFAPIDRLVGFITVLSAAIWVSLILLKPGLPMQNQIAEEIRFTTPRQTPTDSMHILKKFPEYTYTITPLFDYQIKGVVVSHHSTPPFPDASGKSNMFDTRDLCLVWGENAINGSFRQVHFSSNNFSCEWKMTSSGKQPLVNTDISNNHIVPATAEIEKTLKQIKIGDQVELTGKLIKYKVTGNKSGRLLGEHIASTRRVDTGNNAYEVLYLTDMRMIKQNVPWWFPIRTIAKYIALSTLVLWFVLISQPKPFMRDDASKKVDKLPRVKLTV